MKSFYFKRKSVCLTALWGLLCLIGTIGLTSCDDKNEEDDVITLDSYYGATIDEAFFFHPSFMRAGIFSDDVVAEIGPVKGLDNITYIPQYGWNEKLPTKEGYGYVVYNKSYNRHSRVYIVKKTEERTIVKYQCPFIPE